MRLAILLVLTAGIAAACSLGSVLVLAEGQSWRAIASVGVPVGAVWGVMAAHALWTAQLSSTNTKDLQAQLVRREVELGRTSTVDELTGLATRREFDAMVRLEFGRDEDLAECLYAEGYAREQLADVVLATACYEMAVRLARHPKAARRIALLNKGPTARL